MSRSGATVHAIVQRAADVLGLSALTKDELTDRLVGEGLDLGADPVHAVADALMDRGDFYPVGDRFVHVPTQLEGTAWCTSAENVKVDDDLLMVEPDLSLLGWWLVDGSLPLVGGDGEPTGGSVTFEEDGEGDPAIAGPEGWLDPWRGRHIQVRVVGGGLHLEPRDRHPSPSDPMIEAMREAFAGAITEHQIAGRDPAPDELEFSSLSAVLWSSLLLDRAAFTGTGVPPMDVVVAAAGFEREAHLIATAGFDWNALHRWQHENMVSHRYGFDDDQSERLAMLMGASSLMIAGDPGPLGDPDERDDAAAVLALCLADPEICQAFMAEHTIAATDPHALLEFAMLLVSAMGGVGGGGCAFVAAVCLDRLARVVEAEALLTESVRYDENPLALGMLASLHADRGDAGTAVALVRRAGVGGEDEGLGGDVLRELAGYAAHRPRPLAKRNDTCPCGSGRKYKACHLGKERHPLIDRAPWLFKKSHRFVDVHDRQLAAELAHRISVTSGRGAAFTLDLVDSAVVIDLVLSEGGAGELFWTQRDELLPADEAMLAARWQLVERSLFEVEAAEPDLLVLRDVRSGDRIEVTNVSDDGHSRPGTMLLGRPLPVDDTWRAYSGFLPVPVSLVPHVIDALDSGDAFAIASIIGRCFAPPTVQNTDGDSLYFHEITWRVADAAAAAAVLDGSDLVANGDGRYTSTRDTANQTDAIVASLTLTESTLTAEVNSDERADEVIKLVDALLPAAELIDHDMWALDEVTRGDGTDVEDESSGPDLADPAMVAAMVDIMQQYEQRWLDESIPALGGASPREAAADPIGRLDLERLLASFPETDRPEAMSAARLRVALGL